MTQTIASDKNVLAQNISTATDKVPCSKLTSLTVGAIGVVFGDIGTSPLYALKECFNHAGGVALTAANIVGVLSLLTWTFTLIVTFKYALLVMRADNRGEGGILALLTIALRGFKAESFQKWLLVALGIFGAAMFYGDSMITPAISVLSAVEGLEIVAPETKSYVIPITLAILTSLFLIQRHGTHAVGKWFGPITMLWFLAIALLGLQGITQAPTVLRALNPLEALNFIAESPNKAFVAMGSVFLTVTGAEALYADMGHFGTKSIRLGWFSLVMPALLLNYYGQGALMLTRPETIGNPFFLLAPDWALLPMVFLAMAATVIASQAVISGAFSMTAQAIKLGYAPRMQILHTSEHEQGQIYIPFINWMLFITIVLLVLGFKTSSNLASAYGIAVASTMLITTILIFTVLPKIWRWPSLITIPVVGLFLLIDLSLVSANLLKVLDGGWFPLLVGGVIFILLLTWKRGRVLLAQSLSREGLPLDDFVANMGTYPPHRVEGTSIFMSSNLSNVPHALLHNLKHNKILHERVIFLKVITQDIPYVSVAERLRITNMNYGFWKIEVFYGFKDEPDVQGILDLCSAQYGLEFSLMETSFFLARESIVPSKIQGMPLWREHLFAWMSKNAICATDYFHIPVNRVVELGTQVEI